MAGSLSLNVRPPIDAARDWALVRLARPACAKGVLKLRVLPIEDILREAGAGHVFQVAYHRDYTPWKPAYSKPCSVAKSFEAADWEQITRDFADAPSLILHTCDTGGASSGSPILIDADGGPEAIGINVGTYVQSKVLMQEGKVKQRLKADTVANTGVASVASAAKLEAFREAHILSSAAEMRELQGLLRDRHLFSGKVDGTYGPELRIAIEAYEKSEGLKATGLATLANSAAAGRWRADRHRAGEGQAPAREVVADAGGHAMSACTGLCTLAAATSHAETLAGRWCDIGEQTNPGAENPTGQPICSWRDARATWSTRPSIVEAR